MSSNNPSKNQPSTDRLGISNAHLSGQTVDYSMNEKPFYQSLQIQTHDRLRNKY